MAFMLLPTNVRLPTLLDDLRGEYLAGKIGVDEFERGVGRLLDAGTADRASPWHGMALEREWR